MKLNAISVRLTSVASKSFTNIFLKHILKPRSDSTTCKKCTEVLINFVPVDVVNP